MLFGKHINRYYVRYGAWLLLGLFALVVVDYFQLVVPQIYRLTVNGINDGAFTVGEETVTFDTNALLEYICKPMITVILAMVAGRFAWRICFFGSSRRMETDLRFRMFSHCERLSQQYYQENKVGTLMSLFTNDLETVQECFGWGVMMFCDALFLGVLAVVKMFKMNPTLTLFSMIPMALLLTVATLVGKYMTAKWKERQQAFSDLSDFSQENFSGIAVVKAFVKESAELLAFQRLNKDNENANVVYTRASVLLKILVTLFVESVICVILGYGGYLVYIDVFDAGQLVEFIGYFTAIVWPIMAVSELIEMSSKGRASLLRISELLDAPVDVKDADGVKEVNPLKGKIEFRSLSFTYPGTDREVLHDVSFVIEAGMRVGIVGRTGSGKSTLVDLMLRTYNVPDGTVFLDGLDINSLPIRFVRDHMAYVPQDNFLFSDTIASNVAFAADATDTEGICEAARMADVHDNIMGFNNGYDTVLGERGVTVSGGQKQRISIARAIMKDAPILILDDSVSAVDVNTEKVILENLRTNREGKTTILIAHRISTVEDMDMLVFIDEGAVVAVGSHSELYESCQMYREMVDLQRLDDADEEEEVRDNV